LKNIKAIIGTNLEQFFLNLKYPEHCKAACIYKNDEYEIEVWVMPDKVYDIIVKMSSRKFKKLAGENAFWAEWVGRMYLQDYPDLIIRNKINGWHHEVYPVKEPYGDQLIRLSHGKYISEKFIDDCFILGYGINGGLENESNSK
jgi:hypothetical protein